MYEKFEAWLCARFVAMHGEGADNQFDVYRCYTCGKLLTWNFIRSSKFCCAGRVVPAEPRWWEAIKLLLVRS